MRLVCLCVRQDDISRLRRQITELETELRDKNAKIREAEARATAQEAHSKLVVAESQVGAGKGAEAAERTTAGRQGRTL